MYRLRRQTGFSKFAEALVSCEAARAKLLEHPPVKVDIPFKDDLVDCAQHGAVEQFEALLQKVPEDFLWSFESEDEGLSLLHYASRAGNVPVIGCILGAGYPIDQQSRQHGKPRLTPLMEAARADKEEAVLFLLTYGAKIPKLRSADENKSAMDYATNALKEKIRLHVLNLRKGDIPIPELPKPCLHPLHNMPPPQTIANNTNAGLGARPNKLSPSSTPHIPLQHAPLLANNSTRNNLMQQLHGSLPQPTQGMQMASQVQGSLPPFYPPLYGNNSSQSMQRPPISQQMGQMTMSAALSGPNRHVNQIPPLVDQDSSLAMQGHVQQQHVSEKERKMRQSRNSIFASLEQSSSKTPDVLQTSASHVEPQSRRNDHHGRHRDDSWVRGGRRGTSRGGKDGKGDRRNVSEKPCVPSSSDGYGNAKFNGSYEESRGYGDQAKGPTRQSVGEHGAPMSAPMCMPGFHGPVAAYGPVGRMDESHGGGSRRSLLEPHGSDVRGGMIEFEGSRDMYAAHPDFLALPPSALIHELWNLVESLKEDKEKVEGMLAQRTETEKKKAAAQHLQTAPRTFECPLCLDDFDYCYIMAACGHRRPCDACIKEWTLYQRQCFLCNAQSQATIRIYID